MSHLTYLEAAVVGLIQGVSEMFPVSSLGHNVLIPAIIGGSWARDLNVSTAESPYLAFIVGLHVATAAALILYFWRDWVRLVGGFISSVRERRIATAELIQVDPVHDFDSVAQQSFQFRHGAHAATERADGVFIKLGFGEEFSGTAKRHAYTIARDRAEGLASGDLGGCSDPISASEGWASSLARWSAHSMAAQSSRSLASRPAQPTTLSRTAAVYRHSQPAALSATFAFR